MDTHTKFLQAYINHVFKKVLLISRVGECSFEFQGWRPESASKWGMKYLCRKIMALFIVNLLGHKGALAARMRSDTGKPEQA